MNKFKGFSITVLIILTNFIEVAEMVQVKFTKLECITFDRPFVTFKKCYLKALGRHSVGLHMHIELHQAPVNNITVNAELFQKGNGYRLFMYNNTMDLCHFLKNPYRYMFWKIIYDMMKPKLNINRTCPFEKNVIIDGLILNGDMFKLIPFPSNDYMIQIQYAAYNHYRATTRTFFRIYD